MLQINLQTKFTFCFRLVCVPWKPVFPQRSSNYKGGTFVIYLFIHFYSTTTRQRRHLRVVVVSLCFDENPWDFRNFRWLPIMAMLLWFQTMAQIPSHTKQYAKFFGKEWSNKSIPCRFSGFLCPLSLFNWPWLHLLLSSFRNILAHKLKNNIITDWFQEETRILHVQCIIRERLQL